VSLGYIALPLAVFLEQQEKQYLEGLLKITKGQIVKTAQIAGMSRRTLARKLIKHKIDKRSYR
jgi:DNA-binding NtrC family response regulator